MGATYAGLLNLSRLISWTIIHLTVHPEWKAKILAEIREMLDKYDATPESLDRVPFGAWDTDLPLLNMTANEILRTHGNGVLLRQNIGEAFTIDGCTIAKNGLVAYPMADAHRSTGYYGPTPEVFNPGRIESMSDEKPVSFVAWGNGQFSAIIPMIHANYITSCLGRHPCTGKHMAQLIYRQVLTIMLTRFECEAIDRFGTALQNLPPADHSNSLHLSPPITIPVMMRYRARNI